MTTDPLFRMTVEDVFGIAHRGTIATGRIEAGTVKVDDEVTIQGQAGVRNTTVDGIEMFRKKVSQASEGDLVGILLKDIAKQEIQRGDVILSPNPAFS